jgi:hypothetical protein
MKIARYCFILVLLAVSGCKTEQSEIKQAVAKQLELYPESTLQDIYKSFFQDEFGPGHLIEDAGRARKYFDFELQEMKSQGRHEAEPCGSGRNFIRVPMDLVKDSLIPAGDFFQAFMESSQYFKLPELASWEIKWKGIMAQISKMDLQIPDLERDRDLILQLIADGNYVMHHSDRYRNAYDPHYRIMSREQWESLSKRFP